MMIRGKGIRLVAFFLVVMLAGFFCLSAWPPATDVEQGKVDNSTSIRSTLGEDDTPGFQEQEQPPAKIAKKRFPWFWVAAGAVVVGVVLYFTVIKKPEYKLTVAVGTGVSGAPIAGTSIHKKGRKVYYSYKLDAGYKNLIVTLDGAAVSSSGEIKMDRHQTLTAAATEELYYDLTVTLSAGVTGTPAAGVTTHKEMTSVAYSYAETSGYTNLKVKVNGVDAPAQGSVLMDRSHTLSASAEKIPEDQIPPNGVVGTWQITTVCSTGFVYEGTLRFLKNCETEFCQRVTWVNPSGGIGFWRYEGTGISFYNTPSCLRCICDSGGATALARRKAEHDERMYCQGSFSDDNHMSGTFVNKIEWVSVGGGEYVIGTGTWSAYRLY